MATNLTAREDFIGGIIFFAGGAWIYSDLRSLQSGKEAVVEIWAPIAWLYEHFGFGIAVSILPILALSLFIRGAVKYRKESKENTLNSDAERTHESGS